MRDRIWTELTQAKHSKEFSALYADKQRTILRYFNIGVLIFSTSGVMGWKLWNELPLISCIIIAGVSLLRLIQPHIIMSEKMISNIDSIHKFYIEYYNNLEQLWYEFESDIINETEASKKFFKLKSLEAKMNQTINDTIRSKPKKLVKQAKIYSDQYFNQVFNTQPL